MDAVTIVFKHKWKILICTVAGLATAAGFYYTNAPLYESDAKLLVKYVVERSLVDSAGSSGGNDANRPSDTVLNSEVEIFNSWDLFEQVAAAIGANRICPQVKDATNDVAARAIAKGLTVTVVPDTTIIVVAFKSPDPALAPDVLQALLDAYFQRHLDIHRSRQVFEMVSQQTDLVRGELANTEEDIKKKKAEANIISVQDTSANLNAELAETQRSLDTERIAVAEQAALVSELEKASGSDEPQVEVNGRPSSAPPAPGKAAATPASGAAPAGTGTAASATGAAATMGAAAVTLRATLEEVEKYQGCIDEIATLEKRQFELLATYNPDSTPVSLNKARVAELQKERHDMEKEHPDLIEKAPMAGTASNRGGYDLITERARLVSLQAGTKALEDRLQNVQSKMSDFAKAAPEIEELERTEALEQANYATALSKLQNATVDEALDPSKIPNISYAQKPSPPMKVAGKRQNMVMGLAGGGLALGLGLAFLIERVLDQTIKRPQELEQRLGVPVVLSIPYVPPEKPRLPGGAAGAIETGDANGGAVANGHATVAPWEVTHFVRQYAETIRDRLGLYFETNNMTHRPKLLAITGSIGGSGTSTLAAGIASALSETGEGKVLLVDMNQGRTEAHPFFQGRPASPLTMAITNTGEMTSAGNNLYLATTTANGNGGGPFGLKRLREMIPNIKESDFDYVLFDMPPLSQTSPTSAMAAYMDRIIYVVEAEKGQREVVKRDYEQLLARKPDVLVVMNKVRSYAPKWIDKGA